MNVYTVRGERGERRRQGRVSMYSLTSVADVNKADFRVHHGTPLSDGVYSSS